MQTSSTKLIAVAATLGVSTEVRLQRLADLDLSNVQRKLQEPYPEGKGWTKEQTIEAEKWYKRYLAAIIKYPDATKHVPNGPIDFFWHQHILDTMAYGQDCEHVLGYFLHHFPYFGLNGDADKRDASFDETNAIYQEMFGEDCTHMQRFENPQPVVNGAGCNSSGSGTGCGQGCSRGGHHEDRPSILVGASNCNSSGSGTGCGQGCSRGG